MLPTASLPSSNDVRVFGFPVLLRRLIKPNQMDYEFTLWLMLQLLISPKTAYKHTAYHKQTKNQWARDDPAFLVLTCGLIAMATLAFCITYGRGFWQTVVTILSVICVDFIGAGLALATLCWVIGNRFAKKRVVHHHTSEQSVEWLYAFDVHCNSFIPMFVLLFVVQFFLSPLLLMRWSVLGPLLSSLLYVAAFSYYHYMNFLGYSALPFLERTEIFLWPVPLLIMSLPFQILSGFNPTRFFLNMFFAS